MSCPSRTRATEKLQELVSTGAARCSPCPKSSNGCWSRPSAGCGEQGGISQAALLGEASPRVLILSCLLLLSCLTPPLLPLLQSLTSLFYGEQSEKEKSPSESSPLDIDNKDVVSTSSHGSGSPGWAGLILAQLTMLFSRKTGQKLNGRN